MVHRNSGFGGLAGEFAFWHSNPGSVTFSSQSVQHIDIMPGHTKFIPAQVTASETDDSISFRVAFGSNSVVAFGDGPFAQSAAAALVAPSRCVGARLLLPRRCPKQLPTTSRWDLLTAPLVFRLNPTVNKLFRC
jgi:hypothetical protein